MTESPIILSKPETTKLIIHGSKIELVDKTVTIWSGSTADFVSSFDVMELLDDDGKLVARYIKEES